MSALSSFSVSQNTGEKPQSKVWEYNDTWYSVMPDSSGTWVWELNGTDWQKELQLSSSSRYHGDVKVDGDLAHIFLFDGSSSALATIQYDAGPNNGYEMWSLRPSLVNVAVSGSAETAVIDIDSTGRMWVAYDTSSSIEVRYADAGSQYTNWSGPITVASGIKSDDIGSLIAMPDGTLGVMWSNQNTKRFGFRLHVDGADPNSWLAAEVPASQSAQNKGNGMADDHINMAVASDGTLYAAVKTSYDSSGYPRMCLLVRRPSGVWDDLYEVDSVGTRPIVMINEAAGKLIVAYTQSDSGGKIYFKESPLQDISFGPRQTLMSGSLNNVSSVKAPFVDEVVAIAASGSKASGAIFQFDDPVSPAPPTNQAPIVSAGPDLTIQLPNAAALNGTVTDDGNPIGGTLTTVWSMVSGPGTVTFGNNSAIDTTANFSVAGTYVLRLSANDGSLQASDTVTIVVQAEVAPPVNEPPSVSAGPDRSITLGEAASLDGTVSDDGLPSSPGSVASTWTKISGPGTVTFGDASAVDTTASFSATGTYVLRLSASDGSLTAFDEMTVTVQAATPVNQAPTVNAGPDQTIQLPGTATLNGSVTDDGLPSSPGSVASTWTKVSGPGTVTFGNASNVSTTASFGAAGTYVLRLISSDGTLQAFDEVTVVVLAAPVNQAPSVSAGPDRSIVLGGAASLDGTVSDDGLPTSAITTSWTKASGPGTVTFGNASAVDTTASFSATGTYVLRLSASDGQLSTSDEMTVTVSSNSEPVTVAFQDGLFPILSYQGTRDTKIATKSANTNYGSNSTIDLDGSPDISDLLYWDLSAIPSGSVIDSVTIQLNITNTTTQTYEVYTMERPWDEQTATWNQASSGNSWASAGAQGTGDHGSTVLGTLTPTSTGAYQLVLNASGIAAVQGWIDDPSSNFGLILQDYGNRNGIDFSTREASTASQRPKLTVTYQPADSGTVTPPPTNQAPQVNAGNDQSIQLPNVATLTGTVNDDGLPSSPGSVASTWTEVSGPGAVTFGNASATSTSASFSAAGTYVLRLTANDGSLTSFDEVTITVQAAAPVNQAPVVNAGPDQTIQLPGTASLTGSVTDDGLPSSPGSVASTWTEVSGPGAVTFGNASATSTSASFSAAGTYVLRLTANDGSLTSFDEVTITVQAAAPVNQAPVVNAGPDQTIQLPGTASLTGSVTDDGLPSSPGSVASTWTEVSGPGAVTFGNASATSTSASFSAAGTYVLRLTANDGSLTSFDEVTITVQAAAPVNQAPVVNAGPDQTIQLPGTASLTGSVTDDGLPSSPGSVASTWTEVSGPGAVTFGNASATSTSASFSAAGTYVLRLTANDGSLATFDEVTISVLAAPVNQAPVVNAGPDQTIQLPSLANLSATVTDSGGPLGVPLLLWTSVSGPGAVSFGNSTAPSTTADFSAAGTYVLRLTADDGQLTSFDELTITVEAAPVSNPTSRRGRWG